MFRNTSSSYGYFAIGLHWLMAALILFMFGLGLYMVELGYYDPWYRTAPDLHRSIGVMIWLLWILRLTWRWMNFTPEALGSRIENKLAAVAHGVLYLLPFLLVISGYLISTADGRAVAVFNLIDIPALPFASKNQEDDAGLIHLILAWSLIATVTLHGLAALKHHFINKDETLRRMLPLKGR